MLFPPRSHNLKGQQLPQSQHKKFNLSKNERDTLQSLSKDNSIIFKESDKGGAMVLLNSSFYEQRMKTMLNDSETYKEIRNHNEESVMKKIEKFANKYSKSLTKKEIKYISKFQNKDSNIYGLPKSTNRVILKRQLMNNVKNS